MASSTGAPSSRLKRYFMSQISRAIGSRALSSKGAISALYRRSLFVQDQARTCSFDIPDEPGHELLSRQVGRDGRQELNHHRAWISPKLPARPVEPGVERNRHARESEVQVERRGPGLVVRR